MEQMHRLQAINQAIWIRDNYKRLSKDSLIEKIQELAEFRIFSGRQISKICGGSLSHVVISSIVSKTDKSGGRFDPVSLEDIREALFSKERGRTDYKSVKNALDAGTSQNMVARLTGINQSAISRKFGE